jgi:hypothetical protein
MSSLIFGYSGWRDNTYSTGQRQRCLRRMQQPGGMKCLVLHASPFTRESMQMPGILTLGQFELSAYVSVPFTRFPYLSEFTYQKPTRGFQKREYNTPEERHLQHQHSDMP